MTLRQWVRRVHRWLGLVIGIQLLVWSAGGIVFSFFHIQDVRGEWEARAAPPPPLAWDRVRVAPAALSDRLAAAGRGEAVCQATLTAWRDRVVYRVRACPGPVSLVDAETGEVLSPLPAAGARAVARADFTGTAPIAGVHRVETAAGEYRGKEVPAWRVDFANEKETRLYVGMGSGLVTARRNRVWRLYDFFWMLHIMDYRDREDFNHGLLKVMAVFGFVTGLSGFLLWGVTARWPGRRRRGGEGTA